MNSSQIEETLNTSEDGVKSVLSTILNMNLWNDTNEKIIITAINKLLTVSKSRLQGLEFLNLLIDNCSTRVISENGFTWLSHCLVKYSGDELKELKLTTIERIVENSYEEQEFCKKFVAEYISKVLEICLSTHNNFHEHEAALNTFAVCMKYYGSWFAPHKLRIEKFIANFLDSPSEQVVESAATAFHYLQQVGGAGVDGINHKKSFSTNFDKLCVTAQKLFDTFFENEIEIDQNGGSNQEAFEFTDLSHYTQKILHITARRIKNCLTFIQKLLLKGFSAEKEIKPSDVLDLVTRGTAIHRCLSATKDNSLEDFQFSILLNRVQIKLLQLLHVLIIWLHGNALPFTFTVTKILVDCLNRSQSCHCFKTDSIYQETVYKVLGCWIRISRGALHTHFQTQLVKCILKDTTPAKNSVSLTLPGDILKNKSKKAIQRAVQEKIISSGQGTRKEELTNTEKFNREKNCLFALDTLKHLLIGTILKLQPNILQELYTSTIDTLIDIQTSDTSHPYTNPECEAKLYEVLVAFYEQDTLKTLPPLQLTIDILNRGVNSTNRTIALTCEHGLSVLEKICQPVCPSLFISEVSTAEEGALLDVKSAKQGLEQSENGMDGIEQSGVDEEINVDLSDNENGPEKGENSEENVASPASKEIISEEPSSLQPEPSVHILDMRIIKTSTNDFELEGMEGVADDGQDRSISEQTQDDKGSSMVTEIVISEQSCIEIQEEGEEIESVENNEPPLKRVRTEEEPVNGLPNVLKKEEGSLNFEDDIFEEEPTVNKKPQLREVTPSELIDVSDLKKEALSLDTEDDGLEGSDFVDAVKDY